MGSKEQISPPNRFRGPPQNANVSITSLRHQYKYRHTSDSNTCRSTTQGSLIDSILTIKCHTVRLASVVLWPCEVT